MLLDPLCYIWGLPPCVMALPGGVILVVLMLQDKIPGFPAFIKPGFQRAI